MAEHRVERFQLGERTTLMRSVSRRGERHINWLGSVIRGMERECPCVDGAPLEGEPHPYVKKENLDVASLNATEVGRQIDRGTKSLARFERRWAAKPAWDVAARNRKVRDWFQTRAYIALLGEVSVRVKDDSTTVGRCFTEDELDDIRKRVREQLRNEGREAA